MVLSGAISGTREHRCLRSQYLTPGRATQSSYPKMLQLRYGYRAAGCCESKPNVASWPPGRNSGHSTGKPRKLPWVSPCDKSVRNGGSRQMARIGVHRSASPSYLSNREAASQDTVQIRRLANLTKNLTRFHHGLLTATGGGYAKPGHLFPPSSNRSIAPSQAIQVCGQNT